MKNKLTLSIALAAALTLSFLPNIYASGPEGDSDDRYNEIPGAGDCWQDGYKDGQNSGFNEDRNNECIDKGNQYYEAWLHGCENAGNTKDMCITFTDS